MEKMQLEHREQIEHEQQRHRATKQSVEGRKRRFEGREQNVGVRKRGCSAERESGSRKVPRVGTRVRKLSEERYDATQQLDHALQAVLDKEGVEFKKKVRELKGSRKEKELHMALK